MTPGRADPAVAREAAKRLTQALRTPRPLGALLFQVRGLPLPRNFVQGWLSKALARHRVRYFEVEGEALYISTEDVPHPTRAARTTPAYPPWMQPPIELPSYGLRTIYRDGEAVLAFTRPNNKRSAPCKPPPKPTRTARRA